MLQAILPIAYLPPISWWAAASRYPEVILEFQETYPKQTYRNRCNLCTANGLLSLTVPVIKVNGNHTKTSEIRIDYSRNWQQVHWRSILSAYNKTPYFLYYKDFLEPVFKKEVTYLTDLNLELIGIIRKILKLENIRFTPTSEYFPQYTIPDFRELIHPKKPSSIAGYSNFPRYLQAFEERYGFQPDLSILDLLFNEGPSATDYLIKLPVLRYGITD